MAGRALPQGPSHGEKDLVPREGALAQDARGLTRASTIVEATASGAAPPSSTRSASRAMAGSTLSPEVAEA